MDEKPTKKPKKPVLKSTEIVVSYSGKISTGNYENESPFFSNKEVWQGALPAGLLEERQKFLYDKCYAKFTECERRSLLELIKKKRKDIRFYGNLPSVTSILSWDADFYVSPDDLVQYAARGTIIHAQCRIWLETGEWKEPKDIPEIYTQMVILTKGSLKLSLEGYNFRGFKAKNPFEVVNTEKAVFNIDKGYARTQDIKYKRGTKIGIADIKTGSINRAYCLKQLSAYAACEGNEDVEELMVIPLNSSTQQGYSKAIIEEDPKKYLPMFLDDLASFKER
ncbi:MAG: hypothetical protein DRP08_08070, partial [Candidatus Aenigmatarchaeota archaeon]